MKAGTSRDAKIAADAPEKSTLGLPGWYQSLINWLWGYDFFISYNQASAGKYAIQLAEELRRRRFEVFLDHDEIGGGNSLSGTIQSALRRTQRLVVIATKEAIAGSSPWVAHEILLFTSSKRECIPIIFPTSFEGATDEGSERAAARKLLMDYDKLHIPETLENLMLGRPDRERVVHKLITTRGLVRRRTVRSRIVTSVMALLALAVVVVGFFGWRAELARGAEKLAKRSAEQRARIAETQRISAFSQNAGEKFPQRRLLLAAQAFRIPEPGDPPVAMAEQTLRDALGSSSGTPLAGHDGPVTNVVFSHNGQWLITGSSDGTARTWNLQEGAPSKPAFICSSHVSGPIAAAKSGVNVFAFSPDDRQVVTGGDYEDRSLILWTLASDGKLTAPRVLETSLGAVQAVDFSQDGQWLAAGFQNGTARLWNLESKDDFSDWYTLQGEPVDAICSLRFTPDGRWLVTGDKFQTLRVYDLKVLKATDSRLIDSPTIQWIGSNGTVDVLETSPDGNWLATGGGHRARQDAWGSHVYLWNLRNANADSQPIVLEGHQGLIQACAFSSDSRWLATAGGVRPGRESADSYVQVWNMTSESIEKSRFQLYGHTGGLTSLAFIPGKNMLVTASDDKTIRLWQVDSASPNENVLILRGPDGPVSRLSVSSDGRWLAAASEDGAARVWDLKRQSFDGSHVVLSPANSDDLDIVETSSDGRWLLTTGGFRGGPSALWDLTSNPPAQVPADLGQDQFSRNGGALTSDSRRLISLQKDSRGFLRTIRIWNLSADGSAPIAEVLPLDEDVHEVSHVSFSPNGRWLAARISKFKSNTQQQLVGLWSVEASHVHPDATYLMQRDSQIDGLKFDPSHRWLIAVCQASGSPSGSQETVLWDVAGQAPVEKRKLPDCRSIDANGRSMIVVNQQGALSCIDLEADNPLATAQLLEGPGRSGRGIRAQISPDRKWVLSSQGNGETGQLKRLDGSTLGPAVLLRGHSSEIQQAVFSLDGRWLATAGFESQVLLWNLKSEDPSTNVTVLDGHDSQVHVIVFSTDGRWLATGGQNASSRLWDLESVGRISSVTLNGHTGPIGSAAFVSARSGTSMRLITGSEDGTARIWPVDVQQLVELARSNLHRNLSWNEWQTAFPDRRYEKTFADLPVDATVIQGMLLSNLSSGNQSVGDLALQLAKERAPHRNLTWKEWKLFFPQESYRKLLPDQLVEAKTVHEVLKQAHDLAKENPHDSAKAYRSGSEWAIECNSPFCCNYACWYGTLDGFGEVVLAAGEHAVKLAPQDGSIRDSRGLARAAVGDLKGAIEDFRSYVEWSVRVGRGRQKYAERERWITELEQGRNPILPLVQNRIAP